MRGTETIVSAHPQGKFLEGIITTASYPGTIMEIVPGCTLQGGRQSYRASTLTTGSAREILVLLADKLQGFPITQAYVANTRGFLYVPLAGEDLNILVAAEPGTGCVDAFTVGQLLGINSSGLAVPNSAYSSTPFTVQEHIDEVPADTPTLVWCQRN